MAAATLSDLQPFLQPADCHIEIAFAPAATESAQTPACLVSLAMRIALQRGLVPLRLTTNDASCTHQVAWLVTPVFEALQPLVNLAELCMLCSSTQPQDCASLKAALQHLARLTALKLNMRGSAISADDCVQHSDTELITGLSSLQRLSLLSHHAPHLAAHTAVAAYAALIQQLSTMHKLHISIANTTSFHVAPAPAGNLQALNSIGDLHLSVQPQ